MLDVVGGSLNIDGKLLIPLVFSLFPSLPTANPPSSSEEGKGGFAAVKVEILHKLLPFQMLDIR